MNMGAVLLGLLNVALTCAIIVFIAFCIVWVARIMEFAIDGQVFKWGKIIVMLLCLIVVFSWLLSLLGVASYAGPHFLGRW